MFSKCCFQKLAEFEVFEGADPTRQLPPHPHPVLANSFEPPGQAGTARLPSLGTQLRPEGKISAALIGADYVPNLQTLGNVNILRP